MPSSEATCRSSAAIAERARRQAWFEGLLEELGDDRAVLARAAILLQRMADS